ncbi:hypothetical protein V2K56_01960 [Pseudomonas alliivorans]|nr:hypothetical protein [Pseudomonas alliivorans]
MKSKLSLNKSLSLTFGKDVYELTCDQEANEAAQFIRKGILFKAELEAAARDWGACSVSVKEKLIAIGVPVPKKFTSKQAFALDTGAFLDALICPFYREINHKPTLSDTPLINISADLVIGASWQTYSPMNFLQAKTLFQSLDSQTVNPDLQGSTEYAYGDWYSPFPVIKAGEGKNRVSLASQHCIAYLTRAHQYEFAPAYTLSLHKVMFSDYWVLKCSDSKYWPGETLPAFALTRNKTIIALPKITLELLRLYGVQEGRRTFQFGIYRKFRRCMLAWLTNTTGGATSSPWR